MNLQELFESAEQYHVLVIYNDDEVHYMAPSPKSEKFANSVLSHAEAVPADRAAHYGPEAKPFLVAANKGKIHEWTGWSDEDGIPAPNLDPDSEDADGNFVGHETIVFVAKT